MSADALTHVAAEKAAPICEGLPLGDEARALLGDDPTPRQYFARLVDQGQFPDAARFWARALPKREAVWWACLCARTTAGASLPAAWRAALDAAEAWAADPTEANRRSAMPAAEAAGFDSPAGCAAAAAFWSGGSLAPPDLPAVPPADHLTAHGAASAVMLAAVISEPEKAPGKYRTFFDQGIGVAEGRLRWNEARADGPAAPADAPKAPRPAPSPAPARPAINWD